MEAVNETDKLREELGLYRKRLQLSHDIDTIRDQYNLLSDIIKKILKKTVEELKCENAFVQYRDVYGNKKTVVIDKQGIVLKGMTNIVDDVTEQAKKIGKKFIPDKRIFEGNFLVLPLEMNKHFLGALGIKKDSEINFQDELLLEEVASHLDTTIYLKNKEQFEADQRKILNEIDTIIDEHSEDMQKCLQGIVEKIAERVDARFGFIFGNPEHEDFEMIAATDLGKAVWENYEKIAREVKEIVQECLEKDEKQIKTFTNQADLQLVDHTITSIVAIPLSTRKGELVGCIVLGSNNLIDESRQKLIESAASLVDTSIIKGKRAELMLKRFSQYVGPNVLNAILTNPDWLKPRNEDVAFISADLVGSTEYANTEPDAIKVFNKVNLYLGVLAKILRDEYNGTLDKYIGDEIMGLFGAPVRDKNAAINAVECALAMQSKIKKLNEELRAKGETSFDVKITVGTANVVVGDVGSEETQKDYTALGDGVNQFFRIAKFCDPGEIVINEDLYFKIKDRYRCEFKEQATVKGVKIPLNIYRLVEKR